jgi:hypothetical protein
MAYIYRHIRLDKNEPFYIGIGSDKKYQRANSSLSRNSIWKNIVKNTDFRVEIMIDEISYEFAKEKEIEFIEIYKRKEDGGTLCNITKGGDGVLGLVHSIDSRRKMGDPNKGKIISDWHRRRISEYHTGKIVDEKTRKKISEKMSGENNHRYGKKASEDTKRKMSESAKKGSENIATKLTESQVLEIRELNASGLSQINISNIFGVQKNTISCIINKNTWKHI